MCVEMRGEALVVAEGTDRLRWVGAGASWRLIGVWPSAGDRELVDRQLRAGRPLLVVLDREPAVVSALAQEVPLLPEGVVVRGYEAEVFDLEVPALDWLPEPLRRRGAAFADRARADERRAPRHTVPPVIVDTAACDSPVRFALRTRSCPRLTGSLLDPLLKELFPAWSSNLPGAPEAPELPFRVPAAV